MDEEFIRLFAFQVKVQCEFISLAYEYLRDRALQIDGSTVMSFFALQSLIGSAACVRRTMWGQDSSTSAKRLQLRKLLQTDESSPINNPHIRNDFEHFDERIEQWWSKSNRDSFIDMNVLPSGIFDNKVPINVFRHYDPVSGDLTFWQRNTLNVPILVDEAKRIHEVASRELARPVS